MRPLLKIALTVVICAGVILAYNIYQHQSHTKKQQRKLKRKPKPSVKKRSRESSHTDSENVRELTTEDEQSPKKGTKLHLVGSDILHPAPFDNVNMVVRDVNHKDDKIPSDQPKPTANEKTSVKQPITEKISEPVIVKNKKSSSEMLKVRKSNEEMSSTTPRPKDKNDQLTGSMTESEMGEIENSPITFKSCEYVKAQNKIESKSPIVQPEKPLVTPRKHSPENLENGEDVTTAKSEKISSSESVNADQKENVSPDIGNSKEDAGDGKIQKSDENMKDLEKILTANMSSVKSTEKPPVVENISSATTSSVSVSNGTGKSQETTMTTSPISGLISVSSPLTSLGSGASNSIDSLLSSSTDSGVEKGTAQFKLCRCRKNNRNDVLADENAPKFHKNVKTIVPPTVVIPVTYQRYQALNLLEPSGDMTELPRSLFEKPAEKEDTYLTPLNPIVHASYAAHYHACLINNLIENYDFFE